VVSVDDGGDDTEPVTSKDDVVDAVDAVEILQHSLRERSAVSFTVGVILGNGRDLIHDYPDRPEVDRIMEQVQDYAESLGD
jgi:hypothetical protein